MIFFWSYTHHNILKNNFQCHGRDDYKIQSEIKKGRGKVNLYVAGRIWDKFQL